MHPFTLAARRWLSSFSYGGPWPLSSPGSPLRVGGQPSPPVHCRPQEYSPSNLTVTPGYSWSIDTTSVCANSNIQDEPDFQDQVVNTETPVVVDFHAQWVLGVHGRLGYHLFRYLFIERLLCLSTPFDTSHTLTRGHKKSDTTKWMNNNNIRRHIAKVEETQSLLSKITCSLIGDRLVNSLVNSVCLWLIHIDVWHKSMQYC